MGVLIMSGDSNEIFAIFRTLTKFPSGKFSAISSWSGYFCSELEFEVSPFELLLGLVKSTMVWSKTVKTWAI